jgi:hypothetical protein
MKANRYQNSLDKITSGAMAGSLEQAGFVPLDWAEVVV